MAKSKMKNFKEYKEKELVLEREGEELKQSFLISDDFPKRFLIRLKGRKSRAEIFLIYIGKNNSAVDLDVMLIHEASETYGRITLKAALFNEAKINFRGMIEIEPDAKGADSYLLARALLLSDKARAEIRPYLEIKTDDVKASHGSSVGRIDERQLFYLQSRGISRSEAQQIILSGFFCPEYVYA